MADKNLREKVKTTLDRKLFVLQSFNIYGGVAGLFDYGPLGCGLKANVISFWRQHFVVHDDLLEVDCSCLTPEAVLKASGHVDKFTDLMVKDLKDGACYRADHVVKDFIEAALLKNSPSLSGGLKEDYKKTLACLDDLSAEQLGAKIIEYGIKAPDTNNDLSEPFPFNLMFATQIGRSGLCYLRPETAQGIFVNFNELLYYNGGKLPFGAAQIGQAFRNEIAPRQGLLRVREFTLAEIEFFVDPQNKSHPMFETVADIELLLFPRDVQVSKDPHPVKQRLGDAVERGTINSETLGYYIGRTYLFLTKLGIKRDKLRFRQHLQNEMAHYAADCWDAEIECSYGWIECVGLADRSAYDLKAHSEASKKQLVAWRQLPESIDVVEVKAVPNRKEIGIKFKANQSLVLEALAALSNEEALELEEKLTKEGQAELPICKTDKTFTLAKGMVTFDKQAKRKDKETFTPSVIEPSFGLGRIIYCLLEHCYSTRPGRTVKDQLVVLHLPPLVAPIKCTVFSLVQKKELEDIARRISHQLREAGIANKIDGTGTSVGRKYARTDEAGVPFDITVDGDGGHGVTVRDRDTKDQIRVPTKEVVELIADLTYGKRTWEEVTRVYPKHERADDVEEDDE